MVTIDTNIAVYALSNDQKANIADLALSQAQFLSVQVLNEYARVMQRKLKREWPKIAHDLVLLREMVERICPVEEVHNQSAVRLAERYALSFYDAVMIAVALANGATILYSEDMHHGLVIENQLTIINPFLEPLTA